MGVLTTDTISRREAYWLGQASGPALQELFEAAREIRKRRTGQNITYSRKVFIPLTNLCRDQCGYCVFARNINDSRVKTMTPDQVLAVARAGEAAGCKEALFSLGERPELRYVEYREWLASRGYNTTLEYLRDMCQLVLHETELLPHANPGTLSEAEVAMLKPVNVSMGMMLESVSERMSDPGEAHNLCPDKKPASRLATLEMAGRQRVPFTTGILVGIGETWQERMDSLIAIREMHRRYGCIQEVIVQNFRAKAETRFAARQEPKAIDVARTVAVARLIMGDEINIQVPPNLSPDAHDLFLQAGINDWGGISPVTPDHINPEQPWPHLCDLQATTANRGFILRERLAVYPDFFAHLDSPLNERVNALARDRGLVSLPGGV